MGLRHPQTITTFALVKTKHPDIGSILLTTVHPTRYCFLTLRPVVKQFLIVELLHFDLNMFYLLEYHKKKTEQMETQESHHEKFNKETQRNQ